MKGAACAAVAHSPGAGGLSQFAELGEMVWSCSVVRPPSRVTKAGAGTGPAVARSGRQRMIAERLERIVKTI
jgi:hypothetical protein